jgi:putative methyltransferase (TIGR04325 family)
VLASSSLQYSEDWKSVVQKLASASRCYLYITRLPIVHQAASFVVVQRPYQYGYDTEYLGWFLNRQEFMNYMSSLQMELVREFLIQEVFSVPGAPEQGEGRGFLFRPRLEGSTT